MDIDREIAEKVMGWRKDIFYGELAWHDGAMAHIYCGRWHPYTDIRQAFQVVEKMRELYGYEFSLEYAETFSGDWVWHAGFFTKRRQVTAGTPAEAICHAALEAAKANPWPGAQSEEADETIF